MGVLGVSGSAENHIDPPDADEPAPAADQPRDDAGQFVPAEKLQPETNVSRRERQWRERVETYVKPIEEKWATERQTYQQQIEEERRQRQEQAQALARLQGQIEAMQRQPAPSQQQQPAGPDPTELRRKAREALSQNNIDDYERLRDEAAEIIAERKAQSKVDAALRDFQQRQAPQIPLHIQQLMAANPTVMMAGDRGIRAVIRFEQDLEDDGVPAGYDRTRQAFAKAAEKFAKKSPPTRPSYSADSRETLAAIPTGRPAATNGGNESGVRLTAMQEQAMKAGGFKNAEEYLKWNDPHKYGLVK